MYAKQISVFLENRKGHLAEVTRLLTQEGASIRAMCLSETDDFGVLRVIVDNRPHCLRVMKEHGLAAQETDVLAVQMEDKPGGLHQIVSALDEGGVNIEYMYTFFVKNGDRAIAVFKTDDSRQAAEALRKAGLELLSEDVIERM